MTPLNKGVLLSFYSILIKLIPLILGSNNKIVKL